MPRSGIAGRLRVNLLTKGLRAYGTENHLRIDAYGSKPVRSFIEPQFKGLTPLVKKGLKLQQVISVH